MSFRSFWRDVLIESEFKKLDDSTFVFGSPNRFVWPYIVTGAQKEAIASQVLRPFWIAMVISLLGGIAATIIFRSSAVLLATGLVVSLVCHWPRIWVLFRLHANDRVGGPFTLWGSETDSVRLELALYGKAPRAALIGVLIFSCLYVGGSLWLLYHALDSGSAKDMRVAGLSLALASYFLIAAILLWIGRPRPAQIISCARLPSQ